VPTGGLVGYVIPASFLGGPEFSSFRKRVLQLAEVLVVDLIEKRSDVFLDAIQDACFVILRRRPEALTQPEASQAISGVESIELGLRPTTATPAKSPGRSYPLEHVEPPALITA
jgi:adenine-specific DNA-methyltransferase